MQLVYEQHQQPSVGVGGKKTRDPKSNAVQGGSCRSSFLFNDVESCLVLFNLLH
ncbi:hypothetical protein LINPERPRIM_LOCUS23503 [Linum perenne]